MTHEEIQARLKTVVAVAEQGQAQSAPGSDDRGRYVFIVARVKEIQEALATADTKETE